MEPRSDGSHLRSARPQPEPGRAAVLESFFAGRLPAGRLHAELCRAGGVSAAPPPLPADTASIPVPSTGLLRRARELIPA